MVFLTTPALFALAFVGILMGVPDEAEAQVNLNGTEYAIGGYDTVAFFTEGRALRGTEAFSHRWHGATWRFASQENLDKFVASPGRYAPRYGGYCAFAVAQGNLVRIEAGAFTVYQGRLYLNYSNEVRDRWRADKDRFIDEADANWPIRR